MLREVDRGTVEALADAFCRITLDFQICPKHAGMNLELLNAIAINAAIVLAAADGEQAEEARNWFLLALDNQIADFREEFRSKTVRSP
jgi:hypothetical protein